MFQFQLFKSFFLGLLARNPQRVTFKGEKQRPKRAFGAGGRRWIRSSAVRSGKWSVVSDSGVGAAAAAATENPGGGRKE